jgi:hypothetical protein
MLIALRVILLALFVAAPLGQQDTRAALERLADRYQQDPQLIPVTFGVRIDGSDWTVTATPADAAEGARVTVTRGAPGVPTFVYVTDRATFARLVSGGVHALTALSWTDSREPARLYLQAVNGWDMGADGRAAFLSVSSHFFPTGLPEPLAPRQPLVPVRESA